MSPPKLLPPDIFQVSTGSSEPIYRQLMEQLRRLSASGQVQQGDTLPSIREVALALSVNPMTVSKAYSLLENEGLLIRKRGIGMLVASLAADFSDEEQRLALVRPGLERLAAEVKQLELAPKAVLNLFQQILRDNKS
ncbi:GntR family transcriptional regulator [Undibacterium jejuense]|uniref:GntR family transcriptional regulator n=1 Tax=Undibacterium jejuense TaxID=1344949 RepID=A0A923HD40_9BURK|nr:GntR family transcriptional regulator [Undibacterium jejuense]MBC3861519.1 GntR family transcriptional regulator [Undibacterium jejuense]